MVVDTLIAVRKAVNTVFDQNLPASPQSRIANGVVVAMIVASIASVVLDSVESFRTQHQALLLVIERSATAVFALEYVLRVWSAVDRTDHRYREPVRGRLRYMIRPVSIIDLLSVLPAFLGDYEIGRASCRERV